MCNYNLAIFSPGENVYSETFIRAHRDKLSGNIKFYYDGPIPKRIQGSIGTLVRELSPSRRAWLLLLRMLKIRDYSHLFLVALCVSLKKHKIDVILAEYGPTAAHVLEACRKLRIPLVVHFHGYDASVYRVISEYQARYSDVFRYAGKIVAVSTEMAEQLVALGAPVDKIVVTPCAPSDNFFSIDVLQDRKTFISIGRFVEKKAPYYTVLAFQRVASRFPKARLVMIGDGPLLSSTRNVVRGLGLCDRVELMGVQPPEKVIELLTKCTGFIQHSITADDGDKEGTPVAVLEAGAAGLVVIATRHAGIKDVITHEETGLLCDEHDVDGMAENIARVLLEPDFAVRLGENARKHIYDNYRMELHIKALDNAIGAALCDYQER